MSEYLQNKEEADDVASGRGNEIRGDIRDIRIHYE